LSGTTGTYAVNIADFIQNELLLPRLKRSGVLVVYDPYRRYRELCVALGNEEVAVVDASESSIQSREAAMRALGALGRSDGGPRELLIYVPARTPASDEDRQQDPFAVYTACGGVFPEGDGDEQPAAGCRQRSAPGKEERWLRANPTHADALVVHTRGGVSDPVVLSRRHGLGEDRPQEALAGRTQESARPPVRLPLLAEKTDQEPNRNGLMVQGAAHVLTPALATALLHSTADVEGLLGCRQLNLEEHTRTAQLHPQANRSDLSGAGLVEGSPLP
jgi:hypothetical protein